MAARKIVLVTGGNGGIGYETVKAFIESKKPYHVFMGSRSLENANKAIQRLHEECPNTTNNVEPLHVDLTSDESIEAAFKTVQSGPGYIDALVNNAGKGPYCPYPLEGSRVV
jgi:NAD(P)-dependent dehydrogenase (short-subunit alcohol dehydrogenase family)